MFTMFHACFVSVLTTFLVTGVHGLVEAPIPGYGIDPISWELETTPGGPTVILNGTVQEVYAELLKINPNRDAEFEALANKQDVPKDLDSRNAPDRVDCNAAWPDRFSAQVWAIRDGISYLRRVGGQPVMGPGPGNCGRVSCSWDSGIFGYNDNSFTKTLPSFGNIADGAQEVVNQCTSLNSVSGEAFIIPPNDWDVKVLHSWC